MPREQVEPKVEQGKDIVDTAYVFACIHLACAVPLLRTGFGTHAFSGYLMGGILMVFYGGFARCPLLLWYIPVWIGLILFHRLTARRWVHSRNAGYPFFLPSGLSERTARIAEMLVCLFGGWYLTGVSPPLGKFVMAEAASLFVVLWMHSAIWQARDRAHRDALWDAYWINQMQNR